ncbi:MAG: hypothetical protein ACOYNH_12075, partial [Bacteroidia bacterium]
NGQDINIPFISYAFKRFSFVLKYLTWYINKPIIKKNYSDYGVVYEKVVIPNKTYNSVKNNLFESRINSQNKYLNTFNELKKKISYGIDFSIFKPHFFYNNYSQSEIVQIRILK